MTTLTAPLRVLDELADWQREVRRQFPILTRDSGQVYLDSSATAQKPQAVLDAVYDYLVTTNANAGRGLYPWANHTTDIVESARQGVREFIGDTAHDSSVTFVDGTSAGLRSVALDWLVDNLSDGDEIIVPFADHQANALPWTEAASLLARMDREVIVHPLPYETTGSGDYDIDKLARLCTGRTRFIAATHVHHVYGNDMNVHRIRNVCGPDAVICLDAAQSMGHLPIDVGTLDVDFVVFSGHKAMALPGSGAIWARNRRGSVFGRKGWDGTPNTSGAVGISAALTWLSDTGVERIHRWTTALCALLTDSLDRLDSYEVLGCQSSLRLDSDVQRRVGLVTFRNRRIPAHELGFMLAAEGFMVRADGHCQARDGEEEASVRVSLHAYNTEDEIRRLAGLLAEVDAL